MKKIKKKLTQKQKEEKIVLDRCTKLGVDVYQGGKKLN